MTDQPAYTPSRTPDAAYQRIANDVAIAVMSTLVQIQQFNQVAYPDIDTTDAAAVISGAVAGTLEFAIMGLSVPYADIRERIIAQMDKVGAQVSMEMLSGGQPEGRA